MHRDAPDSTTELTLSRWEVSLGPSLHEGTSLAMEPTTVSESHNACVLLSRNTRREQ